MLLKVVLKSRLFSLITGNEKLLSRSDQTNFNAKIWKVNNQLLINNFWHIQQWNKT